jgi:hypothetical protein
LLILQATDPERIQRKELALLKKPDNHIEDDIEHDIEDDIVKSDSKISDIEHDIEYDIQYHRQRLQNETEVWLQTAGVLQYRRLYSKTRKFRGFFFFKKIEPLFRNFPQLMSL